MPSPTTDFAVFDGQEQVTYAALSGPTLTGVAAVRRPLTQSRQRNVERYITLDATDVVLHLDGAPLASVELLVGDSITDTNGAIYGVLFVERQALGNVVVVVVRRTG